MTDGACPCEHTEPCDPRCSCRDSLSSVGCRRCCRYGSAEQQREAALRLVALEKHQHIFDRAKAAAKRFPFPPETPVLSTGYPQLDWLIGCRMQPDGPSVREGRVTKTPLRETGEPLGLPCDRISVVEGPEVPEPEVWCEKLGCEAWRDPDWMGLTKHIRDTKPKAIVVVGEPPGLRFDVLATYCKVSGTTVLFVLPAGVRGTTLKYYAHLRLRFGDGIVKVVKTAISANSGHHMPWPPDPAWVPGPEQWVPIGNDLGFEDSAV